MKGDHSKERDNLTRIEVQTLRTSDDFKNMVNSL